MTEILRRVFTIVRRVLCGATGHERLVHFDRQRVSLRCFRCGHETTGWTIAEPEPTRPVMPPSSRPCMEARRAA